MRERAPFGADTNGRVRYNRRHSNLAEEKMAEPSYEELKAKIAELEKKGSGRRTGALEFRVGEKGGVSVYGLGRFPVTLYREQWEKLLGLADDIRNFIRDNDAALKKKE